MNEIKRGLLSIVFICLMWLLVFRTDVIVGTCTDNYGNGETHNGYYISYSNVKNYRVGDKILTIDILNPFDLEPDSILARYDFITERR